MACILFSRPNHDGTLVYLYNYSKELVKLSQDLGHRTIDKEGPDSKRAIITSVIEKTKPNLIMFNGHGSTKCIFGFDNEPLIHIDENPEILADTITYSFSCSSASELGPKTVECGAISFIGYKFLFSLGKDPDSEATPSRDRIAKFFLEPSNLLFSSLIKGSSVKDSVNKAKKLMKKNVWYLNTTEDFPEAIHYAPFLYSNYLGLVAHGNPEAFISK